MKTKMIFLFSILFIAETITYAQTNFKEHLVEFGSGRGAKAIHSADLDGDGDLDVLTGDSQNKVAWYENKGAGNFGMQQLISTKAKGVSDVFTADLDGDGDLDVMASLYDNNDVVWYQNMGEKLFSAPFVIDSTLGGARSILPLDVDGDGDQDILAAAQTGDQVVWYENYGSLKFSDKNPIGSFNGVIDIKLADFNLDGKQDILAFSDVDYKLHLYRNDGNGAFTDFTENTIITASTWETLITDCDNDGDPDIIIGNGINLKMLENDGTGFFYTPRVIYNSNNTIQTMAEADVDHDGLLDIVYGTQGGFGGYGIGWFKNTTNSFAISYTSEFITNHYDWVYEIAVADHDQDGEVDFLTAAGPMSRVNWFKGLGSGSFAAFKTISSHIQDYLSAYDIGDIDSDGDPDLIVQSTEYNEDGQRTDDHKLSWYANDGSGNYGTQKLIALQDIIGDMYDIQHADIDGDGDMDLLTLPSTEMQVLCYENMGSGNFAARRSLALVSFDETISTFSTGDVDNDGDLDLVIVKAYFTESYILWYENQGDGTFSPTENLIEPDGSVLGIFPDITLIDMDKDNKLDVLVNLEYNNQVLWYHNFGGGIYAMANMINFNLQGATEAIALDLDADGDLDVASISKWDHKLIWQKNNGSMIFGAEIVIDNNFTFPFGLQSMDWDQDGKPDLLLCYGTTSKWYRNLGAGIFAAAQLIHDFNPTGPSAVFHDINMDGKQDILLAESYHAKLAWLENIGTACEEVVHHVSDTICEGSNYVFNGINLFEAGTYIDTILNANGCDSIVVLNLRTKNGGCTIESCNELFISEYLEGSSFNKAIEIYNPTNTAIDLSSYALELYLNGGTVPNEIALSGTIAANGTWLVVNNQSVAAMLAVADQQESALNFNGDDAIALTKNDQPIDLIGQIGVDPGTLWDDGVPTQNASLVRLNTVTAGDISNGVYLPSVHFNALPLDDFSSLKTHVSDCQASLCITRSTITATICQGTSFNFGGQNLNQANVYYDTLTNAASCDSVVKLVLNTSTNYRVVEATACGGSGYMFNGQNLTQSGVYLDTLIGAGGCDSIVKLKLTVPTLKTRTITQTLCAGESLNVYGTIYNSTVTGVQQFVSTGIPGDCDSVLVINLTVLAPVTGTDTRSVCSIFQWIDGNFYNSNNNTATYTYVNGSVSGCDSTVTLNLTRHSNSYKTETISACQTYTWRNGVTYTSTTFGPSVTLTGANPFGCDSIIYLDLTILNPVTSVENQTACGSYTWRNGITYTSSTNTPTFTLPGAASNGCDSIITLNLTILPLASGVDTQVSCGPYTWINGTTYSVSNNSATFTLAGAAANGCDSLVQLNLTVNSPKVGVDTKQACGSYTWIDGNTYTASNSTATKTLTAANGCDSIVTLNLTISTFVTGTDVQSACGSYTWVDGNTYTASNNTASFTYPGGSVFGCDSIVTLNLTILPAASGTDVQSACGSYTWIDGNTYTASNSTATFTLTAANGCDSIVTLNLTILPAASGTDVQSACGSYTWIDGNTYTTSNSTASFTLTAANGCDSIVTLNLTILTASTGIDVQTACGSFTWIDGNTYTTSNSTATFTLVAANGCDSIVQLNLTVNSPKAGVDVKQACGSFTWVDGINYTSSNNVATFTYTASNGCDSVVTLNLTISTFVTGTDVQNACGSFTWIDGNTYTASNNTASFTYPGGSVFGCDSIVTLNLSITNLDLTVTRSGNTLSAAETGASYQWLDCTTMLPIAGENTANYNVTSIGSYAVEVNKNGCLDTTACVLVSDLVGIDEWSATNQFMLYPNPANERLYFKNNAGSPVKLRVLDARGSFLFNWEENQEGISEIPLRNLAAGLYMLEVTNQSSTYILRFEKF